MQLITSQTKQYFSSYPLKECEMTTDMFAMLERATRLVEEDKHDEAYRLIKESVDADPHGFAHVFLSAWIQHLIKEGENEQSKFAEILIYLKDDFPELLKLSEEELVEQSAASSDIPIWLAPYAKPQPAASPVTPSAVKQVATVDMEPFKQPEVEQAEPAEAEQAIPEVVESEVQEVQPEPAEEVEPAKPVKEPEPFQKIRVVNVPEPEERENLTLTFYEWQMSAIAKAAQKEHVDEGTLLARMLETRKLEPLMYSRYRHGKTASPAHRITIAVPHKTKVTLEADKDVEGIKTTTRYVRKVLFGSRAEKA